ncbi:MAG: hypothetical protein MHM6MM_003104 [Cercozoa sp. M6MM]
MGVCVSTRRKNPRVPLHAEFDRRSGSTPDVEHVNYEDMRVVLRAHEMHGVRGRRGTTPSAATNALPRAPRRSTVSTAMSIEPEVQTEEYPLPSSLANESSSDTEHGLRRSLSCPLLSQLVPIVNNSRLSEVPPLERPQSARAVSPDERDSLPTMRSFQPGDTECRFDALSEIRSDTDIDDGELDAKAPIARKRSRRQKRAYCSWCLRLTYHGRIQRNFLRRSVYQCGECLYRTLPCQWCKHGMSRGHSAYDEALCVSCDGTLQTGLTAKAANEHSDIDTRSDTDVSVHHDVETEGHWPRTEHERLRALELLLSRTAWCSWCLHHTTHRLRMRNVIRRDTYVCSRCGGRTVLCLTCHSRGTAAGMARASKGATLARARSCLRCDPSCTAVQSWDALSVVSQESGTNDNTLQQGIERERAIQANMRRVRQAGMRVRQPMQPFRSFAPVRRHVRGEFIVDGCAFNDALADMIDRAKRRIFVSFWHCNDRVYLRRFVKNERFRGLSRDGTRWHGWMDEFAHSERLPADEEEFWRFDRLLQRKAEQGVRIYIVLWKEPLGGAAVDNFSSEVAQALEALHSNVRVLRHGTLGLHKQPWSHHQKFVVVDDSVALVGGLDVCLGRFDTPQHVLHDLNRSSDDTPVWRGVDYYNPHVVRPARIEGDAFFEDVVDRHGVPRMPWHDLAVRLNGSAARDIARNFVERWNSHLSAEMFGFFQSSSDRGDLSVTDFRSRYSRLSLLPTDSVAPSPRGTLRVQAVRSLDTWSGGSRHEASIYGAMLDAVERAEHFIYIEQQYIASSLAGGGVANQLFHRVLQKLRQKIRRAEPFRLIVIVPQPEETGDGAQMILRWQYRTISRGDTSLLAQLRHDFPHVSLDDYVSFHFLRQWTRLPLDSVLARHRAQLPMGRRLRRDLSQVVDSYLSRKERSHSLSRSRSFTESWHSEQDESLLQADHGDGHSDEAWLSPQWPSATLVGAWARHGGVPVTEKVFVHAKVMIVDDRVAIIGSANLNDRSLLGSRDSELAVVVEDEDIVPSFFANRRIAVARAVRDLRLRLWQEHLGVPDETVPSLVDVGTDDVYHGVWRATALRNTRLFERVFPSIASDRWRTLEEWRRVGGFDVPPRANTDGTELNQVRGTLCMHPLMHCCDDDVGRAPLAFLLGNSAFQ